MTRTTDLIPVLVRAELSVDSAPTHQTELDCDAANVRGGVGATVVAITWGYEKARDTTVQTSTDAKRKTRTD